MREVPTAVWAVLEELVPADQVVELDAVYGPGADPELSAGATSLVLEGSVPDPAVAGGEASEDEEGVAESAIVGAVVGMVAVVVEEKGPLNSSGGVIGTIPLA